MAPDSNNAEDEVDAAAVDQLAESIKQQARIDTNEVINKIKNDDPSAFDNAVKLHNAKTYASVCGGKVPPHLDYQFTLNDPNLTGQTAPDHRVKFSEVIDRDQTLDERIQLYRERHPHWWPEMWETAARLDFESRPNEKGQWQVVRNKKELKKLQRAHQLKEGGGSGSKKGKGKGKGKGKAK